MAQGAQTTIHSFQHYVYIYIYIYTRKYSYIHNNFIQESLHLGFVQIQILRAVEIVEIPDGEDPWQLSQLEIYIHCAWRTVA